MMKRYGWSLLVAVAVGCGAADDMNEESPQQERAPAQALNADLPEPGLVTKACGTRSFQSEVRDFSDGLYGSWAGCYDMCPSNSFVYGFAVYDEDEQGSGDDTAINAIAMFCNDKNSGASTGTIYSSTGWWGSWYYSNFSTSINVPARGVTVWQVPSQGSHDDASMLALQLNTNGNSLGYSSVHFTSSGSSFWPFFSQTGTCPSGQAICGLQTRLEAKQGTNVDDTALNGIRLACCTF